MDCDEEREGYLKSNSSAYPAIHAADKDIPTQTRISVGAEEGAGTLIVIAGAAWAVYMVAIQQASPWHFHVVPPGPADICALGALIWLHSKWRHASR